MEKRIRQDRVTRFALLNAELDKLEKEHKKQRDKIIRLMNNGYTCPRFGPYLVVLSEQSRMQISWKDEYTKLVKKMFGPKWRKMVQAAINRAPEVKTPMLLVRVNPDAKHKPVEKVVVINRHRGVA